MKAFKITVCLIVLVLSGLSAQRATAVSGISITVGDLEREVAFFAGVLDFEKVSETTWSGPSVGRLFGLKEKNAVVRQATLRLGAETIRLLEFKNGPAARPVPNDTRGHDRWFQHLAIVVSDMDAAYRRLLEHDVVHVSTAPQTLPDYLPNAAGIRAFYFRDPEGHTLELIWFPPGKGDPRWQPANPQQGGLQTVEAKQPAVFLGIDHTAITVADTRRSLAFYRDGLGFAHDGHSENYGPEQEHLNQVFGARLDINGLHAATGPGLEFLRYIAPPGGRAYPADSRPTDLWHYQTDLRVDRLDAVLEKLAQNGYTKISSAAVEHDGRRQFLLRDPDGHALLLFE
jgi:catechol 2,3-dioxygenase-like lactoylglutathione lyase family enzyme